MRTHVLSRTAHYSLVGHRLERVLDATGLTRQEQARQLGISRSSLATYLACIRSPGPEVLARAVDKFGADPRWLLTGEEDFTTEDWIAASAVLARLTAILKSLLSSGPEDDDLSREDVAAVREAGELLHHVGGSRAMSAYPWVAFAGDEKAILAVSYELNRRWNGIGTWRA